MYILVMGEGGRHLIIKNTKNWYTIDALGAIFDNFDTFDTLNKL